MALKHRDVLALAGAALSVVAARGTLTTPLAELLAAEATMSVTLARLKPSRDELVDVIEGVRLFHQHQANAAGEWADDLMASVPDRSGDER